MDREWLGMIKSIANNHLSKLANEGRRGDTEVALSKHVTPGKLWHVNPQEKSLMERGAGGERLVDAMGSGTFNPKTGLEEKFVPVAAAAAPAVTAATVTAAAAVGSAIIGGISALSGSKRRKDKAKFEEQASQEGLRQLEGAEAQLDTAYGSKTLLAQQDYGMGVEELSAETGMAQEDIHQQTQQAFNKAVWLLKELFSKRNQTCGKEFKELLVEEKKDYYLNLEKRWEILKVGMRLNKQEYLTKEQSLKGKKTLQSTNKKLGILVKTYLGKL